MKIEIKILDRNFFASYGMPYYKTTGSAGMDLMANINSPLVLIQNDVVPIKTGVAIHIKDPGYAGLIMPRSGLGTKQGIVLSNTVGLIDSDYQGELIVSLKKNSEGRYTISPGERIAQLVIFRVEQISFEMVDEFEKSERGEGGFGSTGT